MTNKNHHDLHLQATAITHYEKSVFTATLKNGQTVSHDVYARGKGSVIARYSRQTGSDKPIILILTLG